MNCATYIHIVKRLALAILLCAVAPAALADPQYALQSDVDHVWTMTAAALVLFMQGGFLLLEAGQVRAKNAVNVAQKNLVDFVLWCSVAQPPPSCPVPLLSAWPCRAILPSLF